MRNAPSRFGSRRVGVNIVVARFDGWPGPNSPKIGGVEFRIYIDPEVACADVVAGCASVVEALGVECNFVPVASFAELRTTVEAFEATTAFRTGWVADYPSIENFRTGHLRSGGSVNDAGYANPAVDALLARGDRHPPPKRVSPSTGRRNDWYCRTFRRSRCSSHRAGGLVRAAAEPHHTTPLRELDLGSVTVAE